MPRKAEREVPSAVEAAGCPNSRSNTTSCKHTLVLHEDADTLSHTDEVICKQ